MIGFPEQLTGDVQPGPGAVMARNGMIAAAHPLTVATGLKVLQDGGNAIDAAIAAGLAAAVVMPEMCGLGGDLLAIVHAPGKPPVTVLGVGVAPRGASLEQVRSAGPQTPHGPRMPLTGPLSITVPGMAAACEALLTRFGSRTFAQLVEPAIGLAEHGFALTPMCAAAIAQKTAMLASDPASASIFLPGGAAPAVGSRLRQTDLARTLKRLASQGLGDIYSGDLARRIGAHVVAAGGALTADDLAAHETKFTDPISIRYRDHVVFTTAPPSQGLILLEALQIAQQTDSSLLARGDAQAVHVLAEACKLAYADRLRHAIDPAFGATPIEALLSDAWAARRHALIGARAANAVEGGEMQDGDTTYICVVDRDGMMVSLIQSVSSTFGSGLVAGDTGVLLNNRAGRGFTLDEGRPNIFAPGKIPMSTLHCYSLAGADGTAIAVGGTPGGDGQPQWNLQTLVALIDGGADAQAAIETPRWSIWPGTDPANLPNPFELQVETRLGADVMAGLQARGHRLKMMGDWGAGGAAQLIVRDPDTGVMAGGSDPRSEGMALGF
jgi:gamma-glutamyltranspeptidase